MGDIQGDFELQGSRLLWTGWVWGEFLRKVAQVDDRRIISVGHVGKDQAEIALYMPSGQSRLRWSISY